MWLTVALAVAAAALGYGWYGTQPPPARAVAAAADSLLVAPGMSYSIRTDGPVRLQLTVDWRAQPPLMLVRGEMTSTADSSAISYWVDGVDLYVRDPSSHVWRLRRGGASLPDVAALQPASLAARLRSAAASARAAGRSGFVGPDAAWVYQLPGEGTLLVRRRGLMPLLWRSKVGGSSVEVRWYALSVPPGLTLPASVRASAQPEG